MSYEAAVKFIYSEATDAQIDTIIQVIKQKRAELVRRAKYSVKVGDQVKFTSKGVTYSGKLLATKVKYATVLVNAYSENGKLSKSPISYRVPLNMIVSA